MAAALLFTTVVCAVLFFAQLFRGVYLPMLWWYVRESLHFAGFGGGVIGACIALYAVLPIAVTWAALRAACRAGATNGPRLIRLCCAALAFCRLMEQVSRSPFVDLHAAAVGSGVAIALVAVALSCAAAEGPSQLLQASFGIPVGLYADSAVRGLFDTVDLSALRGFFPVAFVLVVSAMLWQMAVFLERWNLPVSPSPPVSPAAPRVVAAVGAACGLVVYASFACLQLQSWSSLKSGGQFDPRVSLVIVAVASALSVPAAFWTLPPSYRGPAQVAGVPVAAVKRDPSVIVLAPLLVSGICAMFPPGIAGAAAVAQLIVVAASSVVSLFACIRPLLLSSDGLPSAAPVTLDADAPLQHVQGSLHSALRFAVAFVGAAVFLVLAHTAVVQTGAAVNPHVFVALAIAGAFAVRCWVCSHGADAGATAPGLLRTIRAPWAAVVVFCALALANPWLARPLPAVVNNVGHHPADGSLTVASWNLHMGISSSYRVDIDDVAAVLRDAGADVVGLQEVSRGELTNGGCDVLYALSRRTRYAEYVYGPSYELTAGDAILSRLSFARSGHQVMRRTAGTPREFSWAVFDVDGRPFLFVTTHLHHSSGSAGVAQRLSQIEEISAFVEGELPGEGGLPRVVVGDMNSAEGGPEGALFGEVGFRDAWLTCANATAAEQSGGATHPATVPAERLDWVMYADAACRRMEVVPTLASDHRLVVAVFDLPANKH